jgi:hypothetical protein
LLWSPRVILSGNTKKFRIPTDELTLSRKAMSIEPRWSPNTLCVGLVTEISVPLTATLYHTGLERDGRVEDASAREIDLPAMISTALVALVWSFASVQD